MSKKISRVVASLPLGLLIAALGGPAQAQQGFVPPGFERAAAAQELHTDRLLGIDGVVGTGVGLGPRGEPAVVIMTADLGVRGLPRRLDGILQAHAEDHVVEQELQVAGYLCITAGTAERHDPLAANPRDARVGREPRALARRQHRGVPARRS